MQRCLDDQGDPTPKAIAEAKAVFQVKTWSFLVVYDIIAVILEIIVFVEEAVGEGTPVQVVLQAALILLTTVTLSVAFGLAQGKQGGKTEGEEENNKGIDVWVLGAALLLVIPGYVVQMFIFMGTAKEAFAFDSPGEQPPLLLRASRPITPRVVQRPLFCRGDIVELTFNDHPI